MDPMKMCTVQIFGNNSSNQNLHSGVDLIQVMLATIQFRTLAFSSTI
jgi:hypothetical protein